MDESALFLGFDYGTRNIGVAVGQMITRSATVLSPLLARDMVPPWGEIGELLKEWKPTALVVGVPHTIGGSDLKITILARRFIAELERRYGLPVYGIEEMLTTKSAREQLFNQGGYKALQNRSVDSYAAKLILEAWMNEQE